MCVQQLLSTQDESVGLGDLVDCDSTSIGWL
jgi:hypothetical protein